MSIRFRLINEEDMHQFFSWHYEPPYDIYNLDGEPSHEDLEYYLDRQYQYHAMIDEAGEIIAFCSFGEDGKVPGGDYSEDALDIGMGVRPDLTGQGRGFDFVQSVVEFAYNTFAQNTLRVTIAAFNLRAQKVWQKAGFVEVSRFHSKSNDKPFVIYLQKNQSLNQ